MEPFERGKLLLKLMLVLARDRRAMQGRIQTAGFVREYGELPPDLGVATLGRLGDGEIAALADSVGIRPAPAGAKCDILMNGMGYRIESLAAHPPVIVRDVEPDGLAEACRLAGVPADRLDGRLEACRRLREERARQAAPEHDPGADPAAGTLDAGEFRIADPASPLKDDKEWLAPLLEYFWFTGSERGKSHFPADYLLDYDDPLNMNTWRTFDKRHAIESVWERLAIRVAAAGGEGAARVTVRIRVV